jgi:putative RecB family exonuclease
MCHVPNHADVPIRRSRLGSAEQRHVPQRNGVPEQLGFEGMPERLFVATPSKLGAYEDCPRRYRYQYVDRPTPPRGAPWGHNSVGASVHTALRNWFGLPRERRTAGALPTLLQATWVGEGFRDEEQERSAYRTALGWLEHYVAALDPGFEPVGVERVVAAKTAVLAFNGRVDRIDRRGDELVIVDYKTGRRDLDADDARGSSALALYAYAAGKLFHRSCRRVELHHLPSGTVATHEHTDATLARAVARAEATARDIRTAEASVTAGVDPDLAFPVAPGSLCAWCDFKKACPAGGDAPVKRPWSAIEQQLGAAGPTAAR